MTKSLWQERLNPTPATGNPPTLADFNKAWDWVFEKDSNGEFIRAGLCLIIIREKSLKMRKAGTPTRTAEIAAVSLWRQFTKPSLPTRQIKS